MKRNLAVRALSMLSALMLTGAASAQDVVSIRKGESVDLGEVYWQRSCKSMLISFQGVDLLEGPPGLSVSIRQQPVHARRQGCPHQIDGGMVVLTAQDVPEKFEGTIIYRVRYATWDGDKHSTHRRSVIAFP